MLWHPHTERPGPECEAFSALIALAGDEGPGGEFLATEIYNWREGQWRNEATDEPLDAEVYWWCAERDLLALIPREGPEDRKSVV